ncbi:methyltransferase domain-containing protein [Mesobacterium sp. TK19101]|uniref:Methyltransferase domain-containing protein n=1 Tax=Mesobacterium hydrothermale TaxID=3111907 RepID=A0ABU6HB59_9RHOB|nr:methyltransferase domain-containing protein [Mesobacterium sp. TK19101]MEC3859702.1 methyltransferase domain-containing protein [Mesobacterium sp. TK19101]
MTGAPGSKDWNPGTYHRFQGLRLRPAIDLLRSVGPLPDGNVIDVGCGSGAAGPALAQLGRHLTGVDTSPAMLDEARANGSYDALEHADVAAWTPDAPPALIFSNAALHWVPDHGALMPRLAGLLARGGTLAVQMPHQNNAPSHRLWRSICEEMFPGRVDFDNGPSVLLPAQYHHMLAPLGQMTLWEIEYYQVLPASSDGHPVRRFIESTYARPILNALEEPEQTRLIRAYEDVIGKAYPSLPDGSVMFPFRRMFFTLTV